MEGIRTGVNNRRPMTCLGQSVNLSVGSIGGQGNEMQITITLRFDADGIMRHPILFQTNKYRFYSNDKSDNCIPIDNSFIII